MFRFLISSIALAALIVPTYSQSCSVCGDGLEVGSHEAVFTFPGQPDVSCGMLQTAGEMGMIPLAQCVYLPSLVTELCECRSLAMEAPITSTEVTPVAAPIDPPTGGSMAAPVVFTPRAPVVATPLTPAPSGSSLPSGSSMPSASPSDRPSGSSLPSSLPSDIPSSLPSDLPIGRGKAVV